MKAYLDANVYVSYLKGQNNCDKIAAMFKEGLKCKFSVVLSRVAMMEINAACKGTGRILFQSHADAFNRLGKLETINFERQEYDEAARLNEEARHKFGLNDLLHCLLAKKHADVFITSDIALLEYASKTIATFTPESFLSQL